MRFSEHVQRALNDLEGRGLRRTPLTLEGPTGPEVRIDGRTVVHLCANDYLGLANHPTLCAAGAHAMTSFGTGSGASRHVSGTGTAHRTAETALASWVGHPAARLFSSGYATNVGVVQALLGPEDVVFSDAHNHASLIDGCRLSRARVLVYPHRDYDRLGALLRAARPAGRAALVVTDAVFSMDGEPADLPRLRQLCDDHDAALMVDEAHALGVLGPEGAGLCAEQGVRADVLTGMLGKACGAMGGFVAADDPTSALVENRARSFVFSTSPPPAQAAIAEAAVGLVRASGDRRQRLARATDHLRDGLADLGYPVPPGSPHRRTPIIPVTVGDPVATMRLSKQLLEAGVFVHGIRPPSVPAGTSRLRVTVTAAHTDAHLNRALDAFATVRDTLASTLRSPTDTP